MLKSRVKPYSPHCTSLGELVPAESQRRRDERRAQRDARGSARLRAHGSPVRRRVPASLAGASALGALLGRPAEEQVAPGYAHTLREIASSRSPGSRRRAACTAAALAWSRTSVAAVAARRAHGLGQLALRGRMPRSAPAGALGVPVTAVPAGLILTHPDELPPPERRVPRRVARPLGQQPRKPRACVDFLLEERPQARHLFITCNRDGRPRHAYRDRAECAPSCSTSRRTTAAW